MLEINNEEKVENQDEKKEDIKQDDNLISIDEFKKVQIKVGKILEAEDHPDADRLYVLKVDLGQDISIQLVAGIKLHYKKEDLIGKKILVVANLKPAVLRGVESKGMLLAARTGDKVIVISPDTDIPEGTLLS